MDQELTSHALGGILGSQWTPLQRAASGREMTSWEPSWTNDVISKNQTPSIDEHLLKEQSGWVLA